MRDSPHTLGIVGAGAIGSSWAALALAHGLTVLAADPDGDARARVAATVAGYLPALGATDDALERLTVHADVADAAAGADLVLEAGPERLDLKRALFAALDEAAPSDVVLASSSSGFGPSAFQDACRHPDRVVVTHPFNPPHLIPLVEVVPGAATSEEAVATAMAFYTAVGKRPIRLRQEVPGHIANRLQAALWQEAYSLVERGVATVADIDTAISQGPGLRWALLGPFLNQHLSGGAGGIAHILEHLGPPTEQWWRDLRSVTLTPELASALVAGVEDELDGVDVRELIARRDAVLTALLDAKARTGL